MELDLAPLPDGEPPPLDDGDDLLRGSHPVSHRGSHASLPRSDGAVHGSRNFLEILKQIQDLQSLLQEIYEQDIERPRQSFLSPSNTMKSKRSFRGIQPTDSAEAKEVTPAGSNLSDLEGMEPLMTKVSSNKAEESFTIRARQTTATYFERVLRRSDFRFQICPEWNIPDETLCELEKTRLAVTSPSFTSPSQHHNSKDSTVNRRVSHASAQPRSGCAIHPQSRKRIFWDCLAMFALCTEVLTAPLQVYNIDGKFREVADVLNWLTTGYWFLDVPASFLTAVYINDILHTRLADVAKVYLKGWFWFDIAMLAPEVLFFVNLAESGSESDESDTAASGLLRALRARRLVRLVRFARLMRFRKLMTLMKKFNFYKHLRMFLQGWISSALLSLATLLLCVMVAVHFLASLWYVAGDVEGGWAREEGLTETSFAQQYSRSIEWAVSRLPASSLRANVELNTVFERWLAIIATFVSLCVSSLFVSVLTNIMANVARRTRKMTQILDSVRKYCGSCGVSMTHTMKIRKMVEREHFRSSIQEHMQLLLTLPEGQVRELFHEARSLTLAHHPFFLEIGRANSTMELNVCNEAVQELYLLENDTVFCRHEKAQGIYILASGAGLYAIQDTPLEPNQRRRRTFLDALMTVRRRLSSPPPVDDLAHVLEKPEDEMEHRLSLESKASLQNCIFHLAADEFISEQALWISGWKHHGRFEVTVESRALLLSRKELRQVLQDYSDVLATAVMYARCFVSALNKMSQRRVSDMPINQALLEDEAEVSRSLSKARMKRPERLAQVVPSGNE